MKDTTPIPTAYEGRLFPSRQALARHLAPRLGKSVTTVAILLTRYKGDVGRIVAMPPKPDGKPIPIVYGGQQFPSRGALARYLSPQLGRSVTTLWTLLGRHDGDIERIIAMRPRVARPLTFEGRVFPNRKALAIHLAPRLARSCGAVEMMLLRRHDDVEAVLAAAAREKARRPTSAGGGGRGRPSAVSQKPP